MKKILIKGLMIIIILSVNLPPAWAIYKEKAQQKQGTGVPSRSPDRDLIEKENKTPKHVPGQLIIKFKDQTEVSASLNKNINAQTLSVSPTQTGLASINILNAKFKAKSMQPVFKELTATKLKTGKSSKQILQEMKAKFPKRAQRAPRNIEPPSLDNIYKIELSDSKIDIFSVCAEYKKDPNVEFCEPNYIYKIQIIPNDTYANPDMNPYPGQWTTGAWGQIYPDLWGLAAIKMAEAWEITTGSSAVVVAVSDTGVDYNHPDLQGNIWINDGDDGEDLNHNGRVDPSDFNGIDDDKNGYVDDIRGWNFVSNSNDPMDDSGHGTHVAGTIAASANNNTGVVGISWNSKIMPVKGLDASGYGDEIALAVGIYYATQNGADIINMSWSTDGFSGIPELLFFYQIIKTAHAAGVVLIAAAGNGNSNANYVWPAALQEVISVAALQPPRMQRAPFSNWGKIEVAAPGVNILSFRAAGTDMYLGSKGYTAGANFVPGFDNTAYYYRSDGTSMAAPHVSGVAALILFKHPEYTNQQVRSVICNYADDLGDSGFDKYYGFGMINAFRALSEDVALTARISSPTYSSFFNKTEGVVQITGEASGNGFQSYELFYGKWVNEGEIIWIPIGGAVTSPVYNDALGTWDIAGLEDGLYLLKLVVTHSGGTQFIDIVEVSVESAVRQITNQNGRQTSPAISGNRIVWVDETWPESLYLYDISTDTTHKIKEGYIFSPAISGERIVWQENSDIFLFDIATKTERQITTDGYGVAQQRPAISGNRIVWEDYRNGKTDIYLYDLTHPELGEQRITTDPGWQDNPAISGNRIVWEDYRNNGMAIYLYDLNTQKEKQISSTAARPRNPAISGNRVVWEDYRKDIQYGAKADIYLYDLTTQKEQQITSEPYQHYHSPVISGNRVVFLDGWCRLYYVDLNSTLQFYPVTHNYAYKAQPAISGNRIVWEDYRNGGPDIDIYLATVNVSNHVYNLSSAGWYMISLPLAVANSQKDVLFPSAISHAFVYTGSYVIENELQLGKGYWLKFPSKQKVIIIEGQPISDLTIPVTAGWNMIGAISGPIEVSAITSDPPGIIVSDFFQYRGSYYPVVDELLPGNGYWVKVSQNGTLILSADALPGVSIQPNFQGLNQLAIVDSKTRSSKLYYGLPEKVISPNKVELPSTLEGLFDIRFKSDKVEYQGSYAKFFTSVGLTPGQYIIVLSSVDFPAKLSYNVAQRKYDSYISYVSKGRTHKKALRGKGSIILRDAGTAELILEVVNAPPKLSTLTDKTARVGKTLTFKVSAKDPNDDTVGLSATFNQRDISSLNGAKFPTAAGQGGKVSQTFTFVPNASQKDKIFSITFKATDSLGGSDTKTIEIKVK